MERSLIPLTSVVVRDRIMNDISDYFPFWQTSSRSSPLSIYLTEPLTLAPNQVIKGWTEAMQLMKEGAKWELYIPSELGYGDRGAGGLIPGGAALVFTMELLEVMGESQ
jgi:FKBP-type peptidyl-prolyl cis-trans isomerase